MAGTVTACWKMEMQRRITMKVRSRSKPEAFPESGETSLASIMAAVNRFAEGKADKLEYKDSILRLMSGETELSRVTITGGSGGASREIELRKSNTAIQWKYVGDEDIAADYPALNTYDLEVIRDALNMN